MADLLRAHPLVGTGVTTVTLVRTNVVKTINGVVPSSASATAKRRPISRVAVTLRDETTAGSQIYFTVDGTTPTVGGDGTQVALKGETVIVAISAPASSVPVQVIGSAAACKTTVKIQD
jgi:hypothetical protein